LRDAPLLGIFSARYFRFTGEFQPDERDEAARLDGKYDVN
jgi:hypothetical protein